MEIKQVGFIGVGKLGMPCAEAMSGHYAVTGYDIYPKTSDKIKITEGIWGAVKGQDIIFVAVPTPHDAAYDGSAPTAHLLNKDFNYTTVKEVLMQINDVALSHQLVVLISTVLPGTVRNELQPLIYNAKFIYNPYLIAMGSVAWDMVNPEMVIIGTEDGSVTGDAKTLIEFYKPIMENDPRYEVGTWDEAECIKVFYNTYISAKIGLANMIQDVAVKQGNIDVDVVTTALSKSSMRITGPKYMTAGMGDAGPCVLPTFPVTVNGQIMEIEKLHNLFNPESLMLINSANYTCSRLDQKKIDVVTERDYDGDIIKITTISNKVLEITANHLVPVMRNRKLLIVRADEILDSDKLYSVQ